MNATKANTIDIEAIKTRLDCRTIAQENGVNLKRTTGDNWQAHCLHPERHNNGDANASLSIGEKGWHCFGCNAKGDIFDLWQTLYGVTMVEAIEELADLAGITTGELTTGRRKPRRKKGKRTSSRPEKRPESAEDWSERVRIWEEIWEIIEWNFFSHESLEYLEARNVEPETAWSSGVREWATHPAMLGYLRSLTPEEWKAARLLNGKGTGPWYPLEALKGENERGGLAFPIWKPGIVHPIGVRWRYFSPPWDGGPKAMAMAGSGWQIIADPIKAQRVAEERSTILLLEGETDWLAASEAIEELEKGPMAESLFFPIGFGSIAGGWPDELTPTIAKADRVVCMFDVGNGDGAPQGVQLAGEVAKALAGAVGKERARSAYISRLFPDGDDVADHHRRGELAEIIHEMTTT